MVGWNRGQGCFRELGCGGGGGVVPISMNCWGGGSVDVGGEVSWFCPQFVGRCIVSDFVGVSVIYEESSGVLFIYTTHVFRVFAYLGYDVVPIVSV